MLKFNGQYTDNHFVEIPSVAYYMKLNVKLENRYDFIYYVGRYGLLQYMANLKNRIDNKIEKKPDGIINLYNKSTIVDNQYIYVDGNYTESEVESTGHFRSDYIDIAGIKLLYTSKTTNGRSIIWYDENKELNGYGVIPNNNEDYIWVVPTNTKYCIINEKKPNTNIYDDILVCDAKLMLLSSTYHNYLSETLIDKVIGWYGTSIPHGYPYHNSPLQNTFSYANRVAAQLGAKIQNRCVSGGFIISKNNTDYDGSQTLRFTDLESPINYKNAIVDLIGTEAEPDIFVFDWGANDGQFYQSYFDELNLNDLDMTSEDTKTFLGAYNFIIKQTLTAKPDARIILCTHYSDDGESGEMTRKDGYKKMNDLIIKIAEYWHLPVNNVRDKTGWIYNRNGISNIRSVYCKDGIHPAASHNIKSIDILTSIHLQFLKSIVPSSVSL